MLQDVMEWTPADLSSVAPTVPRTARLNCPPRRPSERRSVAVTAAAETTRSIGARTEQKLAHYVKTEEYVFC